MGLDGISINQLRMGSELNSNEKNKINRENNPQIVDGLSKSKKIDPDDRKEKDNREFEFNKEEQEEENEKSENQQEYAKFQNININEYDLSDAKKYTLKIDSKTNNILVIDKTTKQIIQTFSPESLSNLTKYLKNYKGVLINKRY